MKGLRGEDKALESASPLATVPFRPFFGGEEMEKVLHIGQGRQGHRKGCKGRMAMGRKLLLLLVVMSVMVPVGAGDYTMPPLVDGKIFYSEVVQVESTPAKELHARAKLFVAEQYKSAPDVIKLDSPENGILLVKGFMKVPFHGTDPIDVWFTLKIETKDNRYRVSAYDFAFSSKGGVYNGVYIRGQNQQPLDNGYGYITKEGKPRFGWKKPFHDINVEMIALLDSLKGAMRRAPTASDF